MEPHARKALGLAGVAMAISFATFVAVASLLRPGYSQATG